MRIEDLKEGMKQVTLKNVEVVDVGPVREFEKYGRKMKVATAKLKDETGTILCALWNDQTELFDIGDFVSIIDGYVTEFNNELQISSGKTGKIVRAEEKVE